MTIQVFEGTEGSDRASDSNREKTQFSITDREKRKEMQTNFSKGKVVMPGDRMLSKKKSKMDVYADTVVCTACGQRLDAYRLDCMRRHPVLDVLMCKRCFTLYNNKEITVGEDGLDESCRWCCLEGDLVCCDFCNNAFCKLCIRRNLGRAHLNTILNTGEDERWQCYVCNPEPLAMLVEMCSEILEAAEEIDALSRPQKSPKKQKANSSGQSSKPGEKKQLKKHVKVTGNPSVKVSTIPSEAEDEDDEEEEEEEDDEDEENEMDEEMKEEEEGEVGEDDEGITYVRTSTGDLLSIPQKEAFPEKVKETQPPLQIKNTINEKSVPEKKPRGRPRIDASLGHSPATKKPDWQTPSNVAAIMSISLSHRPPNIDEYNVWTVLEKLLAATQSMGMLLMSLKEDLKRMVTSSAPSEELKRKRREIASKLWRAFLAYKKSFIDIEAFTKGNAVGAALVQKKYKMLQKDLEDEEDRKTYMTIVKKRPGSDSFGATFLQEKKIRQVPAVVGSSNKVQVLVVPSTLAQNQQTVEGDNDEEVALQEVAASMQAKIEVHQERFDDQGEMPEGLSEAVLELQEPDAQEQSDLFGCLRFEPLFDVQGTKKE